MKRNKYNPSHYINSIRKRNCIKIKQIFDTGIEGIIDVLENDKHSNDTPLIKEYMKYIDYIKDNVIPNHYINSIRKGNIEDDLLISISNNFKRNKYVLKSIW